MRLSRNFMLEEFTYSEQAEKRIIPTDFQIEKLRHLCVHLLQPIRDSFGPLLITSGLRDLDVIRALEKRGYPVSKTSDHCLVPYLVQRESDLLAPAWAPNPRGKGAADFIPLNADIRDVYLWILDRFEPGHDFNQVIMYLADHSDIETEFIHIANPARIFGSQYITPSRRPILVYTQGNDLFSARYTPFDVFCSLTQWKWERRKT